MSDWESDCDDNYSTLSQNRTPPQQNFQSRGSYSGQSQRGGQYSRNTARGRGYFRGNNKVISIPSTKVGRVIGRGGLKIRDLEYESEARIKIGNSAGDNTDITLFGTNSAIEKVEQMIKDLTIDKEASEKQNLQPETASQVSVYEKFTYVNSEGKKVTDWAAASAYADQAQREMWDKLPPIVKNFYNEDPTIAVMPPNEVAYWRLCNFDIKVTRITENLEAEAIPNPVLTFEQAFKDYPEILDEICKQQFTKPSPIQSQAWPVLLKGEDMIGIAQTGTGKTLAFLLPALIHIEGQPTPREKRPGPTVLILAPTRELAIQIQREVNKYHYKGINSVCIYGGADRREQIDSISKGVDIVIATPGRLIDLIKANHIDTAHFSFIVLDEADRMLDMGFGPQINVCFLNVRPEHQCVMTSATWPSAVRRLADKYMHNPIYINVGSMDLAAVHTVTQKVMVVMEEEKDTILLDFIRNMDPTDKVLIFCAKKNTAADVTANLACKGYYCESLHGDRDQSDREAALEDIMNGTVNILVATDVASRGIDIKDLTHVINLDFPLKIEEYVHRIGRTGRAGKTGIALSLVTKYDWANAGELIKILEEAHQEVPSELREMADRFEAKKSTSKHGRGGRGRGRRPQW
ncbi:probable ATP-dependent RNA helicase DDX43 [Pieris rapae]|uniref:probable ATP-dependent RNA helicase DDX43 n=1 Tax=Pieris rapae TaxID=64459 RepID=UPI001E27E6EE|nr:probable ATP-dependent RNA helicase DDX43 [Pieris rapae]